MCGGECTYAVLDFSTFFRLKEKGRQMPSKSHQEKKIINLTWIQRRQVRSPFPASIVRPYSWARPGNWSRSGLYGLEANTSVGKVGRFWSALSRLPSTPLGTRSVKKLFIPAWVWHKCKIHAFLLILKTHERIFGKCLCETCSTVNTWPYFFERVLSGQKLGYTWKCIEKVPKI